MKRIVPVAGFSGHLALQALAGGDSAVSREAHAVHKAAIEVAESVVRSLALFGEKAAALSRLATLATECAEPGWDGEGAAAIDPIAVLGTRGFVRVMPDGMPLPEFTPEPDGSISLDWIGSHHRLFSLSIGRSNRLAYAWLDGADKGHGVARFDGQNVPPRILEGIDLMYAKAPYTVMQRAMHIHPTVSEFVPTMLDDLMPLPPPIPPPLAGEGEGGGLAPGERLRH